MRELEEVRTFHCGDEPWQVPLARWITGQATEDALFWMQERGTRVWLYALPSGEVVGYGSLGVTRWALDPDSRKRSEIYILPMLALRSAFQGKPERAGSLKFSHQILGDLVAKAARAESPALPGVGLFVDTRNQPAISLYERFGFRAVAAPLVPDEETEGMLQRMLLRLRDPGAAD